MKIQKLIILACIALFSQQMAAQEKSGSYDDLLKKYYKGTVETISPEELNKEMKHNENLILLDAREKNEYDVSHLKNSIYVGYQKFSFKKVKDIPKDAKIIVYCSIGARSENIGEKLKSKGFTNVYNLYGGIFLWKNEGYPVYNSQGEETEDVHAYSEEWGEWLKKGNKKYD